jgi:hypothetical protein
MPFLHAAYVCILIGPAAVGFSISAADSPLITDEYDYIRMIISTLDNRIRAIHLNGAPGAKTQGRGSIMAEKITAITKYRPRIVLERTVQIEELARYIEGRTALNEGEIINVLLELNNAVREFALRGHSIAIRGLGIFSPGIRLDGRYRMHVRVDPGIRKALNLPAAFEGTVENRDNIGKTREDLVDMWNLQNPDDPVVD